MSCSASHVNFADIDFLSGAVSLSSYPTITSLDIGIALMQGGLFVWGYGQQCTSVVLLSIADQNVSAISTDEQYNSLYIDSYQNLGRLIAVDADDLSLALVDEDLRAAGRRGQSAGVRGDVLVRRGHGNLLVRGKAAERRFPPRPRDNARIVAGV